ncbi:MAG: ATP-binding protein [Actinomycetota bacterium]|nr:PAS domain S-box protein [Actinomycetota bacterium]
MGLLFYAIREAIVVGDPVSNKIVLWNPAAEKLFGYTADEASRLEISALMPERMRDQHRVGLQNYSKTGHGTLIDSSALLELPALRKDGTEFTIEMTLTRIDSERGRFALAVIRDISDRKAAQAAMRVSLEKEQESLERLKTVDEMKNAFLTAVSHDIRTPLAIIVGISSTLKRHPEIETQQREDFLDKLEASSHKLEGLLTDLLDVDRLYRGTIEIHRRPTHLGLLIRNLIDRMETRGRRVNIEAPEIEVNVDPSKVERIIENLVTNAVRHTEAESEITVTASRYQDSILIEVADSGQGIPDPDKASVFRAFHRLDGANPSPGAGLGLALVTRFAELHGGRAWVEDLEGGGSCFKVLLTEI